MRTTPRTVAVALCLFALTIPTTLAGHEDDGEARSNVLLTIRTGEMDGTTKTPMRTLKLLVGDDGGTTELLEGSRYPIPTTSCGVSQESGSGSVPIRSFTYQNVGFTISVRTWIHPGRRIQVKGNIEESQLAGRSPDGAPVIETRHQMVDAFLSEGQPTTLHVVDNGPSGSKYVEIEAEILDR